MGPFYREFATGSEADSGWGRGGWVRLARGELVVAIGQIERAVWQSVGR